MTTIRALAAAALLAWGFTVAPWLLPRTHAQESQQLEAEENLLHQRFSAELRKVDNRAQVIDVAERLVIVAQQRHGADHPAVAAKLSWLAQKFNEQRMYPEAEAFYQRALALEERVLGSDASGLLALDSLADFYYERRQLAQAEQLYKRVISIKDRVFGADHILLTVPVAKLRDIYIAQKQYSEAQALIEREIATQERVHGADSQLVGHSLNVLGGIHFLQKRYADAEPLFRRTLDIYELALAAKQADPRDPEFARALNALGLVYFELQRYADAEPLLLRAIAIREANVTPDGPLPWAHSISNLAKVYRAQERHAEAEAHYLRALRIFEKVVPADHPDLVTLMEELAALYRGQGRNEEADKVFTGRRERALEDALAADLQDIAALVGAREYGRAAQLTEQTIALAKAEYGEDHVSYGVALSWMGLIQRELGQLSEAQQLVEKALGILEKALGAEHVEVGSALSNLGGIYQQTGRFAEAEAFYRRDLAIVEKALGPHHTDVGRSLQNFAALYAEQGRNAEAAQLYQRALSVLETALGGDEPSVAEILVSLGNLHLQQFRDDKAEPLLRRALDIQRQALGEDHPDVATALGSLAAVSRSQKRHSEAEQLYRQALGITERTLGPEHATLNTILTGLGHVSRENGQTTEAITYYTRALRIAEEAHGVEHHRVAHALHSLAVAHFGQGHWLEADDYGRRSAEMIVNTVRRAAATAGPVARHEADQNFHLFWLRIKTAYRLAQADKTRTADSTREMFIAAQWARGSEAAASLAQMAARHTQGDGAHARLVRERQDLVREWQRRDKLLTTILSRSPEQRNGSDETERSQLAEIDRRIAEIDQTLAKDFPAYRALASTEPLTIAEVQAQLRGDEVLLLFLDTAAIKPTPDETFIWAISKTEARWVRSDVGIEAMTDDIIPALRCGLDRSAWHGEGFLRCAKLLGIGLDKAPGERDPLPFDLARAHKLYKSLLGNLESLIKNKHLLIVASGPLSQLPFQVLVTKEPHAPIADAAGFRKIEWLAKKNAITVLPAVSSIKALRQHAKSSRATRPLIGFGNPLLEGPDTSYAARAERARAKQSCGGTGFDRATADIAGAKALLQRNGIVDAADLRAQVPLPETADELCAVARDLKVAGTEVRLGASATEQEVKALSGDGTLANYRIIHFATHGTLAGELSETAEPGLILTPPEHGTSEDDGYLSASEIAGLKLDADWVILSACNTAAAAAKKADALSGMARAFFYAGARALLVSHWAVYSDTTVKLITKALATMATDRRIGRAEALRRSMLTLLDKGELREAHPAYWAPFVVVGEGAR